MHCNNRAMVWRTRTRQLLAAFLAALLVGAGATAVAPSAVADDPEHNLVVDLGGSHAADVLVTVYCNANPTLDSSFCSNTWTDSTGKANLYLGPGTYFVCVPASDNFQARCDFDNPAPHRVTITDPATITTISLPLVSKLTAPVTFVETYPVTWTRRQGKNAGWDYEWSAEYEYSFAQLAKNPWISTRMVNQDGVVLFETPREPAEDGFATWAGPIGGGTTSSCGFMLDVSKQHVAVTSTRFEITASVPGGSRTYSHTTPSRAGRCAKPRTLVSDSLRWAKAPQAGKVARVSVNTWPSGVKLSYRWYLNGKRMKKATKAAYRVPKSAAGRLLSVRVTGSGAKFTKSTAQITAKVKARSLGKVAKPKIHGKARVGATLRVKHKSIKGAKAGYQWFAGKKKISGATKRTVRLRPKQAGKRIKVRVTMKKKGYQTKKITSKSTAKVKR
ncbi:hypothetical protein SAMN06309944_1673 [Micrococcales bacterium KH10]|nr:hypothetical protein SAMN06309944_1673 [Micrococcales bacterium KH10]